MRVLSGYSTHPNPRIPVGFRGTKSPLETPTGDRPRSTGGAWGATGMLEVLEGRAGGLGMSKCSPVVGGCVVEDEEKSLWMCVCVCEHTLHPSEDRRRRMSTLDLFGQECFSVSGD